MSSVRVIKRKRKTWLYYYLQLPWIGEVRSLGRIKWEFFEMKRDRDLHRYYKMWENWAFGFNEELINKHLEENQPIKLKIKENWIYNEYLLRPEYIIRNKCSYLNHLSQGYELQIFVLREDIRKNHFDLLEENYNDFIEWYEFEEETKDEEDEKEHKWFDRKELAKIC